MTKAEANQLLHLVEAALTQSAPSDLLIRAAALAVSTRDRQLVAIAAAHLAGETDRVDALAREHLVDYPDSLLVAWIAGGALPNTLYPNTREN